MPGSNAEQPPSRDRPEDNSPPARRSFDPKELLSRLWLQNLPIMQDRMASLEAAAQNALKGTLSAAHRTQASDIAHKLAGSLGMFGYPAGTDISRQMEQMLESDGPLDPAHFALLAAQLRSILPL